MMDRVSAAFNSMFKTKRYDRFTLQSDEDGERRVEVKLSDDVNDEAVEVGQARGSPTFRLAPQWWSRRTTCYVALGILLAFVIGYLLGFVSPHKSQVDLVSCATESVKGMEAVEALTTSTAAAAVQVPEAQMTWMDISKLLREKLTTEDFDETLRYFDKPRRLAGSDEDAGLGSLMFDEFKKLEMEPWTNIHHVQLQTPDSNRPNRVTFGSKDFLPQGYLAYSATGKAEGKLVYGSYGRPEDLKALRAKNIELNGSVLLLRAGNISFAQQVDNAEAEGALAVLIYPDPQDYKYRRDTPLYGHVHLGTGDPYTPGFPSFNHTQFPPTPSSGLPKVLAQTITANQAEEILQFIGGPAADASFRGGISTVTYKLGGSQNISVEVNNVPVNREVHNVFGIIKGFIDPDQYVLLGAQRDAWGPGYARATVGSSILLELAKAVHEMVEQDGFRPRRSLVFASWSAGEFGSAGATEWLEAYMSSIDNNIVSYISLDGAVMGRGSLRASASPLLYSLLERTMQEVKSPLASGTVYDMVGGTQWEANVMRPMSMDDPAYPFLAGAGIPSISFHFISSNREDYQYYGTTLDNMDHLGFETNQCTSEITAIAAQLAGHMALRLVHDHLLVSLDITRYSSVLTKAVVQVYRRVTQLSQSGQLKDLSPNWLGRARGSFQRAASALQAAITNTDVSDKEACRILNDRMMKIEHTLLSPYVSPTETPFRHLLLGHGAHTLASIAQTTDMKELRTQLALATWSLQGCANAMSGNLWDSDIDI
ncbi:transferrin receptor 1b [Aulostomus maculatus]